MKIKINISNKSTVIETEEGLSLKKILERKEPFLLDKYAVAWCDEKLIDFHTPVREEGEYFLLSLNDERSMKAMWHTTSHIMAQAVKRLYKVNLAIGPAIKDGFYYDIDTQTPFTDEDLNKISKEMKKIIESNYPIEYESITKKNAKEIFADNKFKLELIQEIEDEQVSIYKQGEFIDLCKGPHLLSTGKVSAFKLLSVAGSYWRGDEHRESLQRIYGISYSNKESLNEYLYRYEEAKKRDHRKLGRELDLFNIYEDVGAGLVVWHPKGATIREVIEEFWKKEHIKRGYEIIRTPHIAKSKLWKISGHYDYYLENMYTFKVDNEEYVLKPMNCPYHILVYNSDIRSYRDLPIRYAELGTVYRNERSGVLHGMLRVRGFTMDDGHIFCREDQVTDEIGKVLDFAFDMIKTFGYKDFEVHLSVRDPEHKEDYAGNDKEWEKAEGALIETLNERNVEYERKEGEAVFYGPKIDIKIKDALGREWQGPTIQFDFNLPGRFKMKYIGEDGNEHPVYMIHRALLGSLERFVGGLIEHYNGNFPLWLAPTQIRVLTVTDKGNEFAKEMYEKLKMNGFRCELDLRNAKLSKKIRDSEIQKIPYIFIIGAKEVESETISLRHHLEGDIGSFSIKEVLTHIKEELNREVTYI